jgi:hypothetical protein
MSFAALVTHSTDPKFSVTPQACAAWGFLFGAQKWRSRWVNNFRRRFIDCAPPDYPLFLNVAHPGLKNTRSRHGACRI